MPPWQQGVLIWIGLISVVAITVTVYDKYAAPRGKRRIPERTLLWLATVGAAPAMWLTMYLIRHKTKKAKFMIGIPAIFLLEVALVIILYHWIP
jgi:uncharacterized membrane protein YsdA (DUF1294 family)